MKYTDFEKEGFIIEVNISYDEYDLEGMVTRKNFLSSVINMSEVNPDESMYNLSVTTWSSEDLPTIEFQGGIKTSVSFVGKMDSEGKIIFEASSESITYKSPTDNVGHIRCTGLDNGRIDEVTLYAIKFLEEPTSETLNIEYIPNGTFSLNVKYLQNEGFHLSIISGDPSIQSLHICNEYIGDVKAYRPVNMSVLSEDDMDKSKFSLDELKDTFANMDKAYDCSHTLKNRMYAFEAVAIDKPKNEAHRYGVNYLCSASGNIPVTECVNRMAEIPAGMDITEYATEAPVTYVDFMKNNKLHLHTLVGKKLPSNSIFNSSYILKLILETVDCKLGIANMLPIAKKSDVSTDTIIAYKFMDSYMKATSTDIIPVKERDIVSLWDTYINHAYFTEKGEIMSVISVKNYGVGTSVMNFVSGNSVDENTDHMYYQIVGVNRRSNDKFHIGETLTISNEVIMTGKVGRDVCFGKDALVSMVTNSTKSDVEKLSQEQNLSYNDSSAATMASYDMGKDEYMNTAMRITTPKNNENIHKVFSPDMVLLSDKFTTENFTYDVVKQQDETYEKRYTGFESALQQILSSMKGHKEE